MKKAARFPKGDLLLHQGQARRSEASETTGAEAGYLVMAMESKSPLVVRLVDGTELRGLVEGYDRECLVLRVGTAAPLLLRKTKVKYYWLEKPAAAGA
jgi:hypothetical protein